MNIAHHLVRVARARGGAPAVAFGDEAVLDYAGLAARASRLAGALVARFQLSLGDRVALVLVNCPEYLEILYACWHAGLVAVPVNAKLHADELAFILSDSGARACFFSGGIAGRLETAGRGVDAPEFVEVAGPEYRCLLAGDELPLTAQAPEDPAWLFYTSGTTGRPKGAVLSHRNLLSMCFCYFADVDPGAPWRCLLHAAPMSHGSGLYGLAHVMQGSLHVVPRSRGFEPDEIFALIGRWPGLTFFAAPTMVKRLLAGDTGADTSNLKLIVYGGGPMYVEDTLSALERFGPKLSQLYGQGESPMTITALPAAVHAEREHPRWLERLASVGTPQSVVEVQVAGEHDEPLAAGETGEILVRGDSVMSGYWGNAAASAETLRGGWLHTGDIGVFDEEGFLTLKDRSKDVIISGGANIYPREVEEVLVGHPSVAEVSVVGRPDREWGERVVAYVVPAAGARLDEAALDRFCIERLARFKRPRIYRSVEALPKNNYGKVMKRTLREREAERSSRNPHP